MGKTAAVDRTHCPECGTDFTLDGPFYYEKTVRSLKLRFDENGRIHASGGNFEMVDGSDEFDGVECSCCGHDLEDFLNIHDDDAIVWD